MDCGCGSGEYVFQIIEQFGLDARGIEYNQEQVASARRHPIYGDRVSQGDIQDLARIETGWDYAMLNEVLEHVPDDALALRQIHRLLKPGGLLFIFSPNRLYPFETHGAYLRRSGGHISHCVPFVPYIPLAIGNQFINYCARNYWPGELKKLLVASGFSVIDTAFIWQTFEGISQGQPKLITAFKPILRKLSNALETIPLVNRFGISQALVCRADPHKGDPLAKSRSVS